MVILPFSEGTAVWLTFEAGTSSVHAIRGMDDLPKISTRTFIGILFAVSGNILISLALNLQKLAHKRVEKSKAEALEPEEQRKYQTILLCGALC